MSSYDAYVYVDEFVHICNGIRMIRNGVHMACEFAHMYNVQCHAYEWVMSRIRLSHVTQEYLFCATSSSRSRSLVCMRHVTHMTELCHARIPFKNTFIAQHRAADRVHSCVGVMSHTWLTYVTQEFLCYPTTSSRSSSLVCMSHITNMTESSHVNDQGMSRNNTLPAQQRAADRVTAHAWWIMPRVWLSYVTQAYLFRATTSGRSNLTY